MEGRTTPNEGSRTPGIPSRTKVTTGSKDLAELFSLLWNRSSEKLRVNIPETVLLDEGGKISCWFFTSKDGYILKKSLTRSSAASIKETFIEEALADPTNTLKYICIARGGSEPLLLKGSDFLMICDQISLSEDQTQTLPTMDMPQVLQIYIRPLSDLRYTFTYSVNARGDATWSCVPHKYRTRYTGDFQEMNDVDLAEASTPDSLVSEFKKFTLSILHYLSKVHGINPVSIVLEYVQNSMGTVYLTSITSAEWTVQPFQVVLNKQLTHSRSGNTVVPTLDLRSVGSTSRPGSVSGYTTRRSSRSASRVEQSHAPHPPYSSRPGTANRPHTSRSGHQDTQVGPLSASSHIGNGGLAVELTKEVDLCKSQLASAIEDLTRCRELLDQENTRALQAEQNLEIVRKRLHVSVEEKSELASTLSQVWVEAKQQAQDLKQAQKLIAEQETRLASIGTEKDSLARHLSDVIVDLKSKLEDQANRLASYESGGQNLEARLIELRAQLAELREQRDAEQRRVTEMQALLAAREREIRLRLDRGDRIRSEPSRGGSGGNSGGYGNLGNAQAGVKGKPASTFSKVLAQTKKSQAFDDADDAPAALPTQPFKQAFSARINSGSLLTSSNSSLPIEATATASSAEDDAPVQSQTLAGKRSNSQMIATITASPSFTAPARKAGNQGTPQLNTLPTLGDEDAQATTSESQLAVDAPDKRRSRETSPVD